MQNNREANKHFHDFTLRRCYVKRTALINRFIWTKGGHQVEERGVTNQSQPNLPSIKFITIVVGVAS